MLLLEQVNFVSHVRSLFPHLFRRSSVIEIGSVNNADSICQLFEESVHTNIALSEIPKADLLTIGKEARGIGQGFDVALIFEAPEHHPYWPESLKAICKMSRELIILTIATQGRRRHHEDAPTAEISRSTLDHKQHHENLKFEDLVSIELNQLFTEYEVSYSPASDDIFFWGLLKSASSAPTRQRPNKETSKHLTPRPKAERQQVFPIKMSDPNWRTAIGKFVETGWYLWRYPDVAQAGIDAVAHYTDHGIKENRSPNRFFDPFFYMKENPDVAKSGRPAFAHFLEFGRFEGRNCHCDVDVDWCTFHASTSNHNDYFSWMYENCLTYGSFPFNPAPRFYIVNSLSEINAISSYRRYLAETKNDILSA
jgi:hypothetical protein